MNYDTQNTEISHRITEIDTEIQTLQERYRKVPLGLYEYIELRKSIEDRLALLESERERLVNKLRETPQQRRWSNFKDNSANALGKLVDSLPEVPEHVSGRVYLDKNDGCLKWWLIIVVMIVIIAAIVMTINGEWDSFF